MQFTKNVSTCNKNVKQCRFDILYFIKTEICRLLKSWDLFQSLQNFGTTLKFCAQSKHFICCLCRNRLILWSLPRSEDVVALISLHFPKD